MVRDFRPVKRQNKRCQRGGPRCETWIMYKLSRDNLLTLISGLDSSVCSL